MKRAKAKVFIQDAFNQVLFIEDTEGCIDISKIVCALTCHNYHDKVLEIEKSDLILLLDELQQTNEAVTIAEAAEMTESAANEVQLEDCQSIRNTRARKTRFQDEFFSFE